LRLNTALDLNKSPMTAIRLATAADIPALVPLFDGYRQFYSQPSDLEVARSFLSERFARNESVVFIAISESGAALGFTQLYPMFSSTRAARIFVLNDLFVAPEARRKGVANGLLAAAESYAAKAGAVRLTLSTAHTNQSAQKLYEARGWKLEEKFRWYQFAC
jgi:ribosomal protein S18 acetylase RimI-like enzyme